MPAIKNRTHRPRRGDPLLPPLIDDSPEYALGYGRISGTERQIEGLSLPRQHGSVHAHVAKKVFLLEDYFEETMSGKRDDRPKYQALLERVRQLRREGKRVVIVVARLDRIGRNFQERVRAFKELEALGAAIESVDEGRVPAFVYYILAALADQESRLTGARVAEMNDHLEYTGWVASRTPNWGYRWRERTEEEAASGAPRRVMDEHPAEWEKASECWSRAKRGDTLRAISQWAAGLPLAARGGRRLSFAAIRCVLQSPMYAGQPGTAWEVAHGIDPFDGRPPGRWPAMVDRETWDAVRARFDRNKRLPRQASGRYLLTGLLRCSTCGGRMVGATITQKQRLRDGRLNGRTSVIVRYRCSASTAGAVAPDEEQTGAATCTLTIHAKSVEADVLRQVREALGRVRGLSEPAQRRLRERYEQARRKAATGPGTVARERAQLERERAEYRGGLGQAGLLLSMGRLDQEGYDATAAKAKAEIERVTLALEALGEDEPVAPPDPPLDDVLREIGGWEGALDGADPEARRQALAALIEDVRPVRVRVGEYEGDITWTGAGRVLTRIAALTLAAA